MDTQPLGDEPKDESQEVYMVLRLEKMGQVHCNGLGSSAYRACGRRYGSIVKDGSGSRECWSEGRVRS